MADYIKITDYAAKDALLTGNPAKLVKGVEIGADFDAVAVAVATKHDASDIGVTVQAYDADLTTWAGVTPGTGIATALAVNVGTAGAPVINGGVLGTPTSGTVTNLTGTASININGTVGATTPTTGAFTTITSSGNVTVGDAATDTLIVQAGSALLPAIIPTGDANTGVWFPAADTVAVSTGGTERMRIDANGNVGIGATPTLGKVHIEQSAGSSPLYINSTASAVNARMTINTTQNTSSSAWVVSNSNASVNKQVSMYLAGTGTAQFLIGAAAGSEPTAGTPSLQLSSDGQVLQVAAAGLGYGTGAGGTVTQATSRTTAVTLNKPTGAITMFTAAGSATPASFTVNNSLVAATDTVVVSIKSGASNFYAFHVGAVGAGSFIINFWAQSGTAVDTPVLNFDIIKGAVS